MTDLPVCKLCQCEPNQSLSLADPGFRYNCDSHECPIAESGLTLTNEQWTALMGVDRDAVRLDWLIRKLSGKTLRDAGVIYSAGTSTIRSAIDSAMGEQQ
jgi:hypothetical protein